MTSRTTLFTALGVAIIWAILHFLAASFYFYWIYWWYDVMMHFLAGVVGGLAAYWVLFRSNLFLSNKGYGRGAILIIVFIVMFIAGVAWEVLEYTHGMTETHEGYSIDTVNDLILDSLGAIVTVLLVHRKNNNG